MLFGLLVAVSLPLAQVDTTAVATDTAVTVITLEDALRIALSENPAVKVADKEVEKAGYAKKGSYSALFPQISGSASYQRTIKKQVMYMGGDDDDEDGGGMSSMFAGIMDPIMYHINQLYAGTGVPYVPYVPAETVTTDDNGGGIAVGRWNTFSAGISATLPLVAPQLWESIKVSGEQVEAAVEKARESRLGTVAQVKQAYYSTLLAKEVYKVYREVHENAMQNFAQTEMRYKAKKASELEYARAKTTVANAVPNLYNAESSVILSLWQLKAVMGVDLDMEIDVAGELADYADHMFYDIHQHDTVSLENNSSLRQLAIQAEQLASNIRIQKYAYLPTLALNFSYMYNAMTNDFNFSEFHWTPYSYVGLGLNIPIFSGGKRSNDVKQAKVQAEELDIQRQNTERQLRIAIRQNLQTMETNMKSYISAQDALETARKAYDIAAKSYNLGSSTITELNDAQLALTQVQLSANQAIFNFVVAKAGLENTLGIDYTVQEENQ